MPDDGALTAEGRVGSQDELRALYKAPRPRAVVKEMARLDRHCRRFIELSPFVLIGSSGAGGQDVSPRGGPPGFVKVRGDRSVLIPDFPGNNRIDTLENVIETGRVGLLFLLPGMDETLRINGGATVDAGLTFRSELAVNGKLPVTVIAVTAEQVYFHCAKALIRSRLWDASTQIDRAVLPTMGEMLKEQTGDAEPAETQSEMLQRYAKVLY